MILSEVREKGLFLTENQSTNGKGNLAGERRAESPRGKIVSQGINIVSR